MPAGQEARCVLDVLVAEDVERPDTDPRGRQPGEVSTRLGSRVPRDEVVAGELAQVGRATRAGSRARLHTGARRCGSTHVVLRSSIIG